MVDRYSSEIVAGLPTGAGKFRAALPKIANGHEAAVAVVALMDRAATAIPPTEIVDAFVEAGGAARVAVYDELWRQFGQETIDTMRDGADVLALIWDGAWEQGNGDRLAADIRPRTLRALQDLYEDPKFAESLDLDHIAPQL